MDIYSRGLNIGRSFLLLRIWARGRTNFRGGSLLSEFHLFSVPCQFLVFTHVTSALTTVAIRHVGAQTNALNREITVRK